MPIYEYQCQGCGGRFELLIRKAEMKIDCPDCGSSDIAKKFSVFGFKSGSSPLELSHSNCSCGGCSGHNCSGCHR